MPLPPYYSLSICEGLQDGCSTSYSGQLGRRRVSTWGSETASRRQEIEFLRNSDDFAISGSWSFVGVVNPNLGTPTTFRTTHRRTRDQHHSTDLTLLYPRKLLTAKTNRRVARKSRKTDASACLGPAVCGGRFAPAAVLLFEHL